MHRTNRTLPIGWPVVLLALTVALSACEGGGGTSSAPPDGSASVDIHPDAGAGDDIAPADTESPADLPAAVDLPLEDVPPADALSSDDVGPEIPPNQQLAWVWVDPNAVEVEPPVQVRLPHLTDPTGHLIGAYAHVSNCLNKEGGFETVQYLNGAPITIALCVIEETAVPDPDGNYLSLVPPENMRDPDDAFSEVQMYYHVNRVHDYFKDAHGHTGMDHPLRAIVNLQVAITLFGTAWISIENAAFMPKESIAQLGEMIGIAPPLDEDAIIFAQGPDLDMAYDGDVVYHEYTHAVIGGDRLWGVRADEYGADMSPLSLNEAHADYFSATITGDAAIGFWSLGHFGAVRDLTELRRCPEHIIGESHYDGRVFSTALWAIRELLGAEDADAIIFDALLTYLPATSFDEATAAVVANAATLDPPRDAEVAALFAEHGLPGCDRVKRLDGETPAANDLVYVHGTMTTGLPAFGAAAPAHAQYGFTVEDGAEALQITWWRAPDTMSQVMAMLGGAPETVELRAVLKRGEEPVRWTYEADGPRHDGDLELDVRREGEEYEIIVAGTCLAPGPHVLQLIGVSPSSGAMHELAITAVDATALPGLVTPWDCAL